MNLLNRFFPKKKDSNKLYTEALEALLEGDIENAVFKLKDLVQYDTNNIRAYLRLGDIFRENLKVEQALKIHQSLIQSNVHLQQEHNGHRNSKLVKRREL